MTQWEKALATKSDNLSLIPGIHVVARTHSPGLASSLYMYARMHTHTQSSENLKEYKIHAN